MSVDDGPGTVASANAKTTPAARSDKRATATSMQTSTANVAKKTAVRQGSRNFSGTIPIMASKRATLSYQSRPPTINGTVTVQPSAAAATTASPPAANDRNDAVNANVTIDVDVDTKTQTVDAPLQLTLSSADTR